MEEEVGTIVKIRDGNIVIELATGGQCKLCGSTEVCMPANDTGRKITLPHSDKNLKVGTKVKVVFQPKIRILSAVLVFLMPTIFLIFGYFLGMKIFEAENIAIFFSLLGLLFSIGLLWLMNRLFRNRRNFIPSVVAM